MGRISLKKITWCNLRSFDGEHSLSFDERGLTLLRGFNHDTRGESAAGKSSLFIAIAYALDFAPYSAKDLKSWHNEDPMWVELELATPSGPVVIHRGDKTWIKVGAAAKVTSAKGVKEALDKALGINKTLAEALTFRRQRQPGMFLAKKDSEKKQFLVELLDLKWLEAEIDIQVKRVTTAEKEVELVEPSLVKADDDLRFAESAVIPFVPINTEVISSQIQSFESGEEVYATQVKEIEAKYSKHLGDVAEAADEVKTSSMVKIKALKEEIQLIEQDEPMPPDLTELNRLRKILGEAKSREEALVKAEREKVRQWETKMRGYTDILAQFSVEMAQIPGLKTKIVKLDKAIALLADEKCSECLRNWDEAAAQRALKVAEQEAILTQIVDIEKKRGDMEELRYKIESEAFVFDPKIQKMKDVVTELGKQIAVEEQKAKDHNIAFAQEIHSRIADLKLSIANHETEASKAAALVVSKGAERAQELHAILKASVKDLQDLQSQISIARNDLALAASQNAERERAHALQQVVVKRAQAARNAAVEGLEKAKAVYAAERDYLDLLRGFLGQIFEEILREISGEANRVIGAIPNTAGVSLEFAVSRETQDGKIKNEITPIVSFNGHEAPLESGASGGMFTSVEIAVDLAVARIIAQRTGTDLAWLILDESFTGHTRVEKESCLETLKESAQDRLIIIVDHASEMKEMFSKIIDVESRNGHSSITEIS